MASSQLQKKKKEKKEKKEEKSNILSWVSSLKKTSQMVKEKKF